MQTMTCTSTCVGLVLFPRVLPHFARTCVTRAVSLDMPDNPQLTAIAVGFCAIAPCYDLRFLNVSYTGVRDLVTEFYIEVPHYALEELQASPRSCTWPLRRWAYEVLAENTSTRPVIQLHVDPTSKRPCFCGDVGVRQLRWQQPSWLCA